MAKNRGRRAAATVTYQEEEEDKEERGKKFKWVALLMLEVCTSYPLDPTCLTY